MFSVPELPVTSPMFSSRELVTDAVSVSDMVPTPLEPMLSQPAPPLTVRMPELATVTAPVEVVVLRPSSSA
jgi:hypothetical protein